MEIDKGNNIHISLSGRNGFPRKYKPNDLRNTLQRLREARGTFTQLKWYLYPTKWDKSLQPQINRKLQTSHIGTEKWNDIFIPRLGQIFSWGCNTSVAFNWDSDDDDGHYVHKGDDCGDEQIINVMKFIEKTRMFLWLRPHAITISTSQQSFALWPRQRLRRRLH